MEASSVGNISQVAILCEHRMQKIYNQNQCTQISRQAAVSVVVDVVEKGAANNQPTCECVWIVRAISA